MAKKKAPRSPVEREFISCEEAEHITGMSRWTWRRNCYDGVVSSVKIGRRLLIPMTEMRRVIAEGTNTRGTAMKKNGLNGVSNG